MPGIPAKLLKPAPGPCMPRFCMPTCRQKKAHAHSQQRAHAQCTDKVNRGQSCWQGAFHCPFAHKGRAPHARRTARARASQANAHCMYVACTHANTRAPRNAPHRAGYRPGIPHAPTRPPHAPHTLPARTPHQARTTHRARTTPTAYASMHTGYRHRNLKRREI
eukprot:scaffold111720_cov51-Phaeocystis_antarctica.AAC.2